MKPWSWAKTRRRANGKDFCEQAKRKKGLDGFLTLFETKYYSTGVNLVKLQSTSNTKLVAHYENSQINTGLWIRIPSTKYDTTSPPQRKKQTTKTDALTHLSSLIIFFIYSCLFPVWQVSWLQEFSERQALTVGPFVLDDRGSSSFGFEGVFFSSSLASKLSFSNSSLVLSLFSSLSWPSLVCFSSILFGSSLPII